MASVVIEQLERFGPEHCERLDRAQALAYARELATSHYENFTVVSRLLPRWLRPHFAAVYAFCRWADDLGDEVGDAQRSMALLDWWRDELRACYAGEPRHPVFVALRPTVERFEIPSTPFEDLISAFEQDQNVRRYETWPEVLDYCARSANPVGRLVLYMCGYRDERRQALSDATCTALQLVNFWQDVRRDIEERDRIYVPLDVLKMYGLEHESLVGHVEGRWCIDARPAIRELVERTWPMFGEGRKLWPLLRRDVRGSVKLFTLGGERVMRAIERMDYRTLDGRPALSRATKAMLMGRALAGKLVGL
jgi:squalene synthase HpnC